MLSVITRLAGDPTLVPGIYNYCDQWCSFCPMTARCLVFRAMERLSESANPGEAVEPTTVSVMREVVAEGDCEACGEAEDRIESRWRQREPDPVTDLAMRYAVVSDTFLASLGWRPPEGRRATRCEPADVVAWYHTFIAAKVTRAVFDERGLPDSLVDGKEDAAGSVKVALIGIERSRRALEAIGEATPRPEVASLTVMLDDLERMLDERFPEARTFVRPGLDWEGREM